jgi:hypothetical protein
VSIFWQAFCQMRRDDRLLLASVHLNFTIFVFSPLRSLLYLFKFT